MNANGTGARWQGRFAVVRIIVFGMYSCAVVALAAYGLVHGARMDEWRRLWATLYAAVFTLFLPAFVWLRFGYLGINARKSARWRATQLPADAELLPLAADQPAPLTPEELATLPRGFTAVRTVDTSTEQVWRGAWGTFQTVLICGLMLSLTYVAGYASIPNLFNVRGGPAPLFLLWLAAMLLFSLPQAFLPVITGYLGYDAVRWDEHGLRYRRGPLALRDSLLPWDRIQAVLRVDYSPMFASRRAYIMYTANGNFLWGYNPGRTGAINTAGDGQLARLIVTKTGQPVREPVGADVMRELPVPRVPFPGSGRMTRAVAEVTLERLPAEAAERPRATQPTEREERRGRVFMRLAFVPAVVLAALYLAGFVVQVFGR